MLNSILGVLVRRNGEDLRKNGISLYVYTVNDCDQARRYVSQGAEGICLPDFHTAEDLF